MPPNVSSARATAVVTWSGSVTPRARARTRSWLFSARSTTLEASRAVTTALWPAAMTASARARPSPVEQPVMNQVDMGQSFVRRRVGEARSGGRGPRRRRRRVGRLVGGCRPAGEEAEAVLGAAAGFCAVDDQGQSGVGWEVHGFEA